MAIRPSFARSAKSVLATIAKRPIVTGFALASVTLTGTTAMLVLPGDGSLGSRADAATTAYAPDPESLLDGRSPGQRRYGWLLNNKPDRLAFSAGDLADERVLPATRRRPGGGPIVPVVPGAPLTSLGIVPDATDAVADLGDPGVPSLIGGGIGGIGGAPIIGGVTGPGGGGGGGTPTDPATPTPETLIPAVPEPASWAMLVLGFAALGMVMRRRRSVPVATTTR